MAKPGTVEMKASDVAKEITVTVRMTGVKTTKFRLAVAKGLMKLSAFIAGTIIKIEGA